VKDLTAFQRDALRLIAGSEKAPIGLEIKRKLQDYYGSEVNHGRLYPNLDTLVEKGYVEKQERDGRTNEYLLTIEGQEALKERDEFNESNQFGNENLKTYSV